MFNKKTQQEPFYDILDANASFELKEAYNSLCTNVLYASDNKDNQKLVVTSSLYGEGKTAVAVNLSIALASNLVDKKILLVDADLRKPCIFDFVKDKATESVSDQGLVGYLLGKSEILPITKTNLDNLDVIFAGGVQLNPAALMNSPNMKEFLDKCSDIYDYVILDVPPLNDVSDALLLIGKVDGYIIAAKTKYSKLPMLDATQEALSSVGANILGIVLTDTNHKK